jgi:hypothetical protein
VNTRKKLHRAAQRRAADAKSERRVIDNSFMYKHTQEMRKMLKGVDLDRFERLAGGS